MVLTHKKQNKVKYLAIGAEHFILLSLPPMTSVVSSFIPSFKMIFDSGSKFFYLKFLATSDEMGQGIPNDGDKRGGRKGY